MEQGSQDMLQAHLKPALLTELALTTPCVGFPLRPACVSLLLEASNKAAASWWS